MKLRILSPQAKFCTKVFMRRSPKDEAEFCEVSSVMAVLIEQLLLSLLEQLDGLLALLLQVLNEDLEVLIRVQEVQLVLEITHS